MDLLERTRNLTQTVLDRTFGVPLGRAPPDDYETDEGTTQLPHLWNSFQSAAFRQAHLHLRSVNVLVNGEHADIAGTLVITRTLFELSADLTYINGDLNRRMVEYLTHGGYIVPDHTSAEMRSKIEGGKTPIPPNRRWKHLNDICDQLDAAAGNEVWRGGYLTFYRLRSMAAHGVFYATSDAVPPQGPTRDDRAKILVFAMGAFFRIAKAVVAAQGTDAMRGLMDEYQLLAAELFQTIEERASLIQPDGTAEQDLA